MSIIFARLTLCSLSSSRHKRKNQQSYSLFWIQRSKQSPFCDRGTKHNLCHRVFLFLSASLILTLATRVSWQSEGPRLPWQCFGLWQSLRGQERGRLSGWKGLAKLLKKSLTLTSSLDKCHDLVTSFLPYDEFSNNPGIILLLRISIRQIYEIIIIEF